MILPERAGKFSVDDSGAFNVRLKSQLHHWLLQFNMKQI